MIAKSRAIKGRGGKFGGCAVKAVGLTSGGLCRVRKPRTERFRKGRDWGAEVSRWHSSRLAGEGLNDGQGYQNGTLMRTERQNIQLELALEPTAKGEARSAGRQGTEARMARVAPERPAAGQGPSMEAVIQPGNLRKALARVRELTRCTKSVSLAHLVAELSRYLIGWRGYFGFCETPSVLSRLDQWIRRRLRAIVWRQWKRGRTRFAALRRLGVNKHLAAKTAGSARGPWRLSNSPALSYALPNAFFIRLGLATLASLATA